MHRMIWHHIDINIDVVQNKISFGEPTDRGAFYGPSESVGIDSYKMLLQQKTGMQMVQK